MYLIKLNAIDSTNSYLMSMVKTIVPKDYTVVITEFQTEGKGQIGSKWKAEKGKNLTASVFKKITNLNADRQFYISMVVSLSICSALNQFKIPKLHIKWPNDILSEDNKICGVLIENVIKANNLNGSVIGFGLNVNQKYFENLPKASSLSLKTGLWYDIDEILSEILKQLKAYFLLLENQSFSEIKLQYENLLFRKDKPSTFSTNDKTSFSGIIKGVTNAGKLKVWTEDEVVKTFGLKEVKLLY